MLTTTWLPRAYKVLLLGVAFFMIAAIPAAACPPDKSELTVYKEIVFNPNHQDPVVGEFAIATSAGSLEWTLIDEDLTSRPALRLYQSRMLTVEPGVYTLGETGMPGYLSGGWSCDGKPVLDGSVKLEAGHHTACSITNTHGAFVYVTKDAPLTDEVFDIEIEGVFDSGGAFSRVEALGPGDTYGSGFAPGDFTLDEINIPDGWELEHVRCSGIEDPIVGSDADVAFHLEYGDIVRCTFVNEPLDLPTITVKKLTPGVEATEQLFDFDLDYLGDGDFAEFSLGSGGERMMTVRPGSYSLNELVPAGWALTGSACKGGESVRLDGGDAHAVVAVGYGDNVVCTFTNELLPTITVEKTANASGSFEFTLSTEGRSNTQPVATGGSYTWTVVPDVYNLVEEVPLGAYWSFTGVECEGIEEGELLDDGAAFWVGYGDEVTCTFSNLYNPPERVLYADVYIDKVDLVDPIALDEDNPIGTVTYVLTVGNSVTADLTATGVVVTDTLPPTLTYKTAVPTQGTCSHAASVVTCDVGTLAVGATTTITVTAETEELGSVTEFTPFNRATVSMVQPDANPANNSASEETTITEPPPTAVESEVLGLEILPETGAEIVRVTLIASALIVAGGCALLLARREESIE